MTAFPPLRGDVRCDVAIVGGGITSALIARELAAHGHDVCVVEQRDIAWGSTAASTALLQYEIDAHLVDLSKRFGEDNGALAYRACACGDRSKLQDVARDVRDVGFARCDSLYYASRPWHVRRLRAEGRGAPPHRARCALASEADEIACALRHRSARRVADARKPRRVDPYRLASRMFQRLAEAGRRDPRPHDGDRHRRDVAPRGAAKREAGPTITAVARDPRRRLRHAAVARPARRAQPQQLRLHQRSARRRRAGRDRRHRRVGNRAPLPLPAHDTGRAPARRRRRRSHRHPRASRSPRRNEGDRSCATARRPCCRACRRWCRASRGPAPSPKPRTACRSSARTRNAARACTSRWPTAATASRTRCSARALLRAQIERRAHPLAKLFGFERLG